MQYTHVSVVSTNVGLHTCCAHSLFVSECASIVVLLSDLLPDFLKYFPCLIHAVLWNCQRAESLSSSSASFVVECDSMPLTVGPSCWQELLPLPSEISIGTTRSTSSRLPLLCCFGLPACRPPWSRLLSSLRRAPRLAVPGIESFLLLLLAGRVLLMRLSGTGMVKAGSVLLMRLLGTEAAMLGNGL